MRRPHRAGERVGPETRETARTRGPSRRENRGRKGIRRGMQAKAPDSRRRLRAGTAGAGRASSESRVSMGTEKSREMAFRDSRLGRPLPVSLS